MTRAGVAVVCPRPWLLPLRLPTEATVRATLIRAAISLEDVSLLRLLCARARSLSSPGSRVTGVLGRAPGAAEPPLP